MWEIKRYFKIYWNRLIILISDIYYYHKGDSSTMYKHKLEIGLTPSWRDNCRKPVVGIFRNESNITV